MPPNALAKKMKLKPGQRGLLINAPKGYLKTLRPFPEGASVMEKGSGSARFDWVQMFAADQAELAKHLPRALHSLAPESLLWLSFPKGSSKSQSDLTRDKGWDRAMDSGLKWVTLISVNEMWSAFALRPHRPGEPKQT